MKKVYISDKINYTVHGLFLCIPRQGKHINRNTYTAFLLFPVGD
jgi:hypothetical protein